jgi:Nuclease-related domain
LGQAAKTSVVCRCSDRRLAGANSAPRRRHSSAKHDPPPRWRAEVKSRHREASWRDERLQLVWAALELRTPPAVSPALARRPGGAGERGSRLPRTAPGASRFWAARRPTPRRRGRTRPPRPPLAVPCRAQQGRCRSEDEVRRALAPLREHGWRLRHGLRWQGNGDIDSVAIAPTGLGFAIETKTRTYDERQLGRVLEQARWLGRPFHKPGAGCTAPPVAGGAGEPLLARCIRSSKRRSQDAYAAPRRRRTRTRSRRLPPGLRERLCSPARTPALSELDDLRQSRDGVREGRTEKCRKSSDSVTRAARAWAPAHSGTHKPPARPPACSSTASTTPSRVCSWSPLRSPTRSSPDRESARAARLGSNAPFRVRRVTKRVASASGDAEGEAIFPQTARTHHKLLSAPNTTLS